MRMKRLICVFAVFVLIAALSACGSDPAGTQDPAESAAESEAVQVMFATEDLSLEPVTSEELFAGNKVTMINVWATFCGYCIEEMPDLEELSGRLQEKGCGIIGVVGDVEGVNDEEHLQQALEILETTGVTYPNLIPWDHWYAMLPVPGFPTTFFVDSEGNIIGEPAVGARGADDYEALLDEALAAIGE